LFPQVVVVSSIRVVVVSLTRAVVVVVVVAVVAVGCVVAVVVVLGIVGMGLVVDVGVDVVGPDEVLGADGCVVVTMGLVLGGRCVVPTLSGAGPPGVAGSGIDTPITKPGTVVANTGPADPSMATVPNSHERSRFGAIAFA
jgi:hypothetical protein